MKNWKKWLVAGCIAALLGIGTMGTTAMAMGGGGVERSEAVAEEEKVPSGKATQNSRVSSKAWKKINGVCYNGSGQKLEGAGQRRGFLAQLLLHQHPLQGQQGPPDRLRI